MFQLLILKGIGDVCHLFIVIEFVHNHRNNLQCLVAHIAQRDLEQLFRLCEICPCIVGHRVHLDPHRDIEVGKHHILAGPEVERLGSDMCPPVQVLSVSRNHAQAVGIHERELEVILVEQ